MPLSPPEFVAQKMSKILIVINEHPSLSQTFAVNEAAALDKLGADVLVYALKRGSAGMPAAEVELIRQPPRLSKLLFGALLGPLGWIRAAWRGLRESASLSETGRLILAALHAQYVSAACREAGVEHIHAHFLARPADVADAVATRIGCSWSVTAHAGDAYAPPEPVLLRRRLAAARFVTCASESVRDSVVLRSTETPPRTLVVHCGVDTDALAYSPRRVSGAPVIVTVGRLVATKGHRTILAAAAELIGENPRLSWRIVGDGPLRAELLADERYLALRSRVTFLGGLDHAAALGVIREADLFVLPCESDSRGGGDGIPVALMESMALGVPVITTPVGGIRELVTHNVNGLLVTSASAAGLSAEIRRVLYALTPEEREALCSEARKTIEGRFDQEHEASKLLAAIRSL